MGKSTINWQFSIPFCMFTKQTCKESHSQRSFPANLPDETVVSIKSVGNLSIYRWFRTHQYSNGQNRPFAVIER